jgi:hypothetical protein
LSDFEPPALPAVADSDFFGFQYSDFGFGFGCAAPRNPAVKGLLD